MLKLTILILDLSEGQKTAFCATIKEFNNSKIMGDSIQEIFELIPTAIGLSQSQEICILKQTTGLSTSQ